MREYETTRIRQAIHKQLADDSLLPKDGVTYCNLFVYRVCESLGCKALWNQSENRPMLANEAALWLKDNILPIDSAAAFERAKNGALVIAVRHDTPHGHIAVVYPSQHTSKSGRWGIDCPIVANVGRENGVFGANWAFQVLPEYYELA